MMHTAPRTLSTATRPTTLAALLAIVFSLLVVQTPAAHAAGRTLYVDGQNGRDVDNAGWRQDRNSFNDPWQTIYRAIRWAEPGDTIVVRGGTYVEELGWGAVPGRANAPITLTNYEDERVVVKGHLKLEGADYWTVDGINVTYDPGMGRRESLVKFDGGRGWKLLNSEIWGTRGVSNVMINGSSRHGVPQDYRISGNCIHTNLATGDPFMNDHNVYLQPGYDSGPGIIDRNIMFGASNGANIKAAGGNPSRTGAANVDIRFNTFSDAGASVIIGYASSGIRVRGNLFGPQDGGDDNYNAGVVGNKTSGRNNVAEDNAAWGYELPVRNDRSSSVDIADVRNRILDPRFDSRSNCNGFNPKGAATAFGRYGDGDFPRFDEPAPAPAPKPGNRDSFVDDDASAFENDIERFAAAGITRGCNPPTNDRFCPDAPVTRAQMAVFLTRALTLPTGSARYTDVPSSSPFRDAIAAFGSAGITSGCGGSNYCPDDAVTRQQMAVFLTRGLGLKAGSARFSDVASDSPYAGAIASLADAGITRGCGGDKFCPDAQVTRGQMAAFLTRALDL